MARFGYRETLTSFGYPNGLSALHASATFSGPVIYAATLSGGGVTAFVPDGTGGFGVLGSTGYPDPLEAGVTPVMAEIRIGGETQLAVSGLSQTAMDLDAEGAAEGWAGVGGYAGTLGAVRLVGQGGRDFLLSTEPDGDLVSLEPVAGGLALRATLAGLGASGIVQAPDGAVYAVSGATDRITRLTIDASGGLAAGQVAGALDGLGWDVPSAIRATVAGGEDFLVVAGAGSSSLTVLGFGETVFEIADHIIDDRTTRFAGVTALDTVSVNGRSFVAAGGGDDGVTLFEMLPGGRLVHLQTEVDTVTRALSNVSAVSLFHASGQVHLVTASQSEGLSVFSRPASSIAAPRIAGHAGVALTGGAADDLLYGGAGADTLSGGGGDDILFDGEGVDTLRGGAGADIFVFASDGVVDRVEDFEPGVDRLDLSAFPGLYALTDLVITPTTEGARLAYRDEVIEIRSASGVPLDAVDFPLQDVLGVTRPTYMPIGRDVSGTDGPETLFGGTGDDRLSGLGGDDTLFGLAGGDMLMGGSGDDLLDGGPGRDIGSGGVGADTASGGAGPDSLLGGPGPDRLEGGDGGDLLSGGSGSDTLLGGAGNDILRGGSGDDALSGGGGADRLSGGAGIDRLEGGAGGDMLDGGSGDDLLIGGPGADVFVFRPGAGRDTVADFAPGDDRLDLSLHAAATDWQALRSLLQADSGGTRIDFSGDDAVFLAGIGPGTLSADDFLF